MGFALSRMLKASSGERYRQSSGRTAQLSPPGTGTGNGSGASTQGVSEGLTQARYDR